MKTKEFLIEADVYDENENLHFFHKVFNATSKNKAKAMFYDRLEQSCKNNGFTLNYVKEVFVVEKKKFFIVCSPHDE